MQVTTRVFEASAVYRLLSFEVLEGAEFSVPEGSIQIHAEPIEEDGHLAGFDIWLLVPSTSMAESVSEVPDV